MADLIPSILAHAFGGVALALLVWGLGLGAIALAQPGRADRRTGAHAYALGLAIATVAAGAYLFSPWLAIGAVPLLLVCLAGLVRIRASLRAPLLRTLAAVPGAVGLGTALGFLLHAPTSRLNSNAYGDMLYYVSKQLSAGQSLRPFRDFLVEGEHGTYIETAPTFIGGALSHILPLNAFLFQTTLLPAFLLTAVAFGFGLASPRSSGLAWMGLLLVTMAAYPTWLTESPPVALALPLAFSLHALYRDRTPARIFAALMLVLAFDFVLTKGFGLLTLGAVAATAVFTHHRGAITRGRAAVLTAAMIAAAAAAVIAFVAAFGWLVVLFHAKFLPTTAYHGLRSEFTVRSTQQLAPALEVAGELALVALLLRARLVAPLAALAVGIAGTWFVGGHGLDITIGIAIVLAALSLLDVPAVIERERALLALAAVLLALSAWFRDISGIRAGFVFCALFAAATVAFVERWDTRRAVGFGCVVAGGTLVALGGHPVAAAALAAAALVVAGVPRLAVPAAAGALAAGVAVAAASGSGFGLTQAPPTLTSADYGIWRAVRAVAPPDGLVFTSLTGDRISGYEGWDYYPGVARRQLYLAGWSDSPLLVKPHIRRARLASNAAVLQGRTRPAQLDLSRRYSSFFAVIRRSEPVPPSFSLVYENDRFALYRIES